MKRVLLLLGACWALCLSCALAPKRSALRPRSNAPAASASGSPAKRNPDGEALLRAAKIRAEQTEFLGAWGEGVCTAVAKQFADAGESLRDNAQAEFAAEAFHLAGEVREYCGDLKGAIAMYEAALSAMPSHEPSRVAARLATAFLEGGAELDDAIETYRKLAAANLEDAEVLTTLGALLVKRANKGAPTACGDDLACARAYLTEVISKRPSSAEALTQLSLVYYRMSEARAEQTKNRKPSGGPETPDQLLEMAEILARKAIRADGRYGPAHHAYALALEKRRNAPALPEFKAAAEASPLRSDLWLRAGLLAYQSHDNGFADTALHRAWRLQPRDENACAYVVAAAPDHVQLAPALDWQTAVENARDIANQCLAVFPDSPEVWFASGVLHQDLESRGGSDWPRQACLAIKAFQTAQAKAAGQTKYAKLVVQAIRRVRAARCMCGE